MGVLIHADNAHRPLVSPTECEIGDVDAVPAQDRADIADHPWLILVGDQDKSPLERRLYSDSPDRNQAKAVRLEDRSLAQRSPSLVRSWTKEG